MYDSLMGEHCHVSQSSCIAAQNTKHSYSTIDLCCTQCTEHSSNIDALNSLDPAEFTRATGSRGGQERKPLFK
jgi:hypothetical protein